MFYELAIAAGYCFYFTSAYCLITGVLRPQRSYSLLVLGGTTLGLAVGARPNYVFAAIATMSALTYVLLASSGARVAQLKSVLVVMLPFSCVIMSLLAYNYVRFDRFSEFGQKYLLTGFRPGKFMSSKYFFDNFNAYILSPARIDRHFPFFHLRNQPSRLYSFAYGEPVGGVLPTAPFACAMLALLPLWKFSRRAPLKDSLGALVLLATLFCLNGSVMVLYLCFYGFATERYVLDFIPSYLFSSLLVWIAFHHRLGKLASLRRIINGLFLVLLAYQFTLNMAVSLTGYYDNLLNDNPRAYAQIKSWFSAVEKE